MRYQLKKPHAKTLRVCSSVLLLAVSFSVMQAKACVQVNNDTDTLSECINTSNPKAHLNMKIFCKQHQFMKNKAKQGVTPKALVFKVYPFEASEKDKRIAFARLPLIKAGQPINSACKLLGQADEIRVLYEPKAYKPKAIGFTYWYIYRRGQTANHLNDQVIRVSTDKELIITKVDSWGFE